MRRPGEGEPRAAAGTRSAPPGPAAVVKVGGGLARRGGELRPALAPLPDLAARGGALVVPGGGPFADPVRVAARRHALDDSTAHWMAILAMDAYAHLLTGLVPGARLVRGPLEIVSALAAGAIPVLAPHAWLREADPLPHGWHVSGDSIAAWVAGQVRARRLLLLKRAGHTGVDPYFAEALPAGVRAEIVVPQDGRWLRTR